jgi:hypothetical protein
MDGDVLHVFYPAPRGIKELNRWDDQLGHLLKRVVALGIRGIASSERLAGSPVVKDLHKRSTDGYFFVNTLTESGLQTIPRVPWLVVEDPHPGSQPIPRWLWNHPWLQRLILASDLTTDPDHAIEPAARLRHPQTTLDSVVRLS